MDWVRVCLAGKVLLGVVGVAPVAAESFLRCWNSLCDEGSHDLIRNYITGGADFSKQHDVLNQSFKDAGMNVQGQTGRMTSRGFKAEGKRNEEQEKSSKRFKRKEKDSI